jgi:molybdopterin molybdotransferase
VKPGSSGVPAAEARRRLAEWAGSTGAEEVPLEKAAGRVLARELRAGEPVPAFPRSAMDGYAVRAADTAGATTATPVALRLTGRVAMGEPPGHPVGPGEACAISTGAHLPPGADAVVMLEDTTEADGRVDVVRPAPAGRHVIGVGDDLPAGSSVLTAGRRLGQREVAALAAFGQTRVAVHQRARVAVLSTGPELCPVDEEPPLGRVRDMNQHALAAGVEGTGACATRAGIAPEDPAALADRLRTLLADHDAVLVSGGSSVGARDFTAEAVRMLGADLLFHGIDVRPGRPTLAAHLGEKMIFGLPGVPAAALTIFQVLVDPVLRRLQGESRHLIPELSARLHAEIPSRLGREDYLRVRLEKRGDEVWALPLPGANSLAALVRADGLIVIPGSVEKLAAGAIVQVRVV